MSGKFKLIAGLGNRDIDAVFELISLWAKAGADIFDTSLEILPELQKKLAAAGFNLEDFEFCVSLPLTGDIHGKKAKIDPKLCRKCEKCVSFCSMGAINPPEISSKCIGCLACRCEFGAISFFDNETDFANFFDKNVKIDTVEVHISVKDKKIIKKEFKKIIKMLNERKPKISVCLSRKYFSNQKTEKILKKMKKMASGFDFVVQADGNSMNRGNNEPAGTIEAVAYGLFIKNLGYDVILSGGCNEFTPLLAKKTGLECSIAFGGYARKITSGLNQDEALIKAKELVKIVQCGE